MHWLAGLALLIVAGQSGAGAGRITGVVTDAAGGLIPGATITLRSAEWDRRTVTDSKGSFTFNEVPAGRYAAIASLVGFSGEPQTGVVVPPGRTVSLEFQLYVDCLAIVDYADMGFARVATEAGR